MTLSDSIWKLYIMCSEKDFDGQYNAELSHCWFWTEFLVVLCAFGFDHILRNIRIFVGWTTKLPNRSLSDLHRISLSSR